MLRTTGTLAAATILGAGRSSFGAATIRMQPATVISKQPHLYIGWPTLTRRRNGELLLVFSGGREAHVCPFGRVEMMRSKDEGKSWSWPRVIMDGAIDDRDAGLLETARGSILVTTFTSLAYAGILQRALARDANAADAWAKDKLARWREAHARISQEQQQRELGVWMIRSTDGGVEWSQRYRCLVNSPHGPIQLSDGRLLYAGKELWQEPHRVGVCESNDDGQSWRWLAEIPTRAGDDRNDYHELHAVETASGRILAQIRNHNKSDFGETLQTESTDGGKTWSTPHSIGVWGYPSHLLRLADDRILMTYGHRRKPLGNQARLSEDDGTTWSDPLLLVDESLVSSDFGYPSTVQLDDGSLLSVWYAAMKGSPHAVLRQARWTLDA